MSNEIKYKNGETVYAEGNLGKISKKIDDESYLVRFSLWDTREIDKANLRKQDKQLHKDAFSPKKHQIIELYGNNYVVKSFKKTEPGRFVAGYPGWSGSYVIGLIQLGKDNKFDYGAEPIQHEVKSFENIVGTLEVKLFSDTE